MDDETLVEKTRKALNEDSQSLLDKFNQSPMTVSHAHKICKIYEKKGMDYPLVFLEECRHVGRMVYFIDYDLNGRTEHECVEGISKGGIQSCPFKNECGKYKNASKKISRPIEISKKEEKISE